MIFRRLLRTLFYSSIPLGIIGLFCSLIIADSTAKHLYNDISQVPAFKTGVILGTSKQFSSGKLNLFFKYRMDAAEILYKNDKVKQFILSGDNRTNEYNEPRAMRAELLKRGIPDSCMFSDYAGLRTFDSMVRCKEIFGQDSVLVISQQFQNERAVFIGRKRGIAACGFNARQVTYNYAFKTRVREFFSRIKCILDIYILGTQPRHLGAKEKMD